MKECAFLTEVLLFRFHPYGTQKACLSLKTRAELNENEANPDRIVPAPVEHYGDAPADLPFSFVLSGLPAVFLPKLNAAEGATLSARERRRIQFGFQFRFVIKPAFARFCQEKKGTREGKGVKVKR